MTTNGKNYSNGYSGELSHKSSLNKNLGNEELFDFKQFYSIIKRHIWLIIICVVISTGVAYYLAYDYFLPVYRSSSTLLIQDSPNNFPGGTNEISKIISSAYLTSNGSLESQIQFVKSRELSHEVAKQVLAAKYLPDGSIYPILWKNFPEDSTIASEETVANRVRYGISVEPTDMGSDILSVSFESYSRHEAARVVNFSVNAYKEITAEKKRESAKSALEFLENKRTEVKSQLDEAEDRLSGFKNNQNLVSIDSQTNNLVNAVSNLKNQKQEIEVKLEAAKSGIKNYESQLEAIKPGLGEKYSKAAGPTITSYQQQLAKLQTERLVLVSNNPQLRDHPESEPKMRQLDKQISDLKDAIKKLTDDLMADSDNYLGMLAESEGNVTQEISKIQSNLTQLQIEKNQYEAQLKAINERLSNNEEFLDKVPENQKQLGRLQRQVQISEELFRTVNDQVSQVSLWEQTQSSSGTVIDYAQVPGDPVKPQKILWLFGGFLMGLILPVGFVVMKEAMTGRINSIQDLQEMSYPLLAVVYHHSLLDKKQANDISEATEKSKDISEDLILYHYGLSPIAESYRTLVSKILYSHPDKPPKTLLITSPGAGEGKTTLTANIATALVETGNRVLVIDCDMRKPAIPKFFGISREPGIMEVLFKDYTPEEAVRGVPIPGLEILTTGKKQPARPTSVIGSQSFKKMIEKFKLEYDFILLDSAPFGIIGDSAPILHLTDGVIVTSRFLSTKHVELNYTLEQLEDNSAEIIGLVLNGYNPKKSIDDAEVKGLYNNKYTQYYDYHEKENSKKKKHSYGRFS